MPKHVGSHCDYIDERDYHLNALSKLYAKRCFSEGKDIVIDEQARFVVSQPAPRFWVSETRASFVIGQIESGKFPSADHPPYPERLRMYTVLYARYLEQRAKRPTDSRDSIMFDVVNSEAPESYISPDSVKVLINRHLQKIRRGEKIDITTKQRKNEKPFNHHRTIAVCGTSADRQQPEDIDVSDGGCDAAEPVEDNVQHSSCRMDSSVDKCILPIVSVVHVQSEVLSVLRGNDNRLPYSKRIALKHTNIRYLRNQLRFDWY